MENDEKEDRIEKMVKESSEGSAFYRIRWIFIAFFSMAAVWPIMDLIEGRTIDWRRAIGFVVFGIISLLVYAIIGRVVERSKRYSSLDGKEKDEKKWKLFCGFIVVFFVVVFIVCGILD